MIKPFGKYRYVLMVINIFSRCMEAQPTTREDAGSAAKFLLRQVIPRFGIPDRISLDNGQHFVNKVIDIITQALRIKRRLGCVYHPQSPGIVECQNGILTAKIAKMRQVARKLISLTLYL